MKYAKDIESYLSSQNKWYEELIRLREILKSTELVETLKWGIPVYTINGKNVVGLAAFKNYVGLWFYNGVFLTDSSKVLINAQEGTTKALRQWRFTSSTDINEELILAYLEEAIQNQKEGKTLKIEKKSEVKLPTEILDYFKNDQECEIAFAKLTKGKQREYAEYINSAKQDSTKLKRIGKIVPLIKSCVGLNDKYKRT